MENQNQDNANGEVNESHKAKGPRDPRKGVHAVMQHVESGVIETVSGPTRREVGKLLAAKSNCRLVAVFRGKHLDVKERKTIHFV